MAHVLFGTDGIRGVANRELTPEMAFRLGQAIVAVMGNKGRAADPTHPRFLIGRDTRRSGAMLQGALAAGITSSGGDALLAGIVPTPALAALLRPLTCAGGVMISASHNPPEYNGLKVFAGSGYKLSDADEAALETLLQTDPLPLATRPIGTAVGRVIDIPDAAERYVARLVSLFAPDALAGLTVALDCGHGASAATSAEAFTRLGASVTAINSDFSGDDINVNSGSTYLNSLSELVRGADFDLGIAHDGDADRTLAVDQNGTPLDGDQIMAIAAADLQARGLLTGAEGPTVVATVVSNLGFKRAMADLAIHLEETAVGDRHVLERMRQVGANLGGEQSGHVIYLDHNTTGDGLLSALMLADATARSGKKLSELAAVMSRYPQSQQAVRVARKDELEASTSIAAAITAAEAQLGDNGRVLVRASGTEPVVRVMAEAADLATAKAIVDVLADVVARELS